MHIEVGVYGSFKPYARRSNQSLELLFIPTFLKPVKCYGVCAYAPMTIYETP